MPHDNDPLPLFKVGILLEYLLIFSYFFASVKRLIVFKFQAVFIRGFNTRRSSTATDGGSDVPALHITA